MKVEYKSIEDSLKIDISKLRPKKSYKYLFDNRNHNIQKILLNGSVPKELLHEVDCHCCGSNDYKKLFMKDGFEVAECNKCNLVYVPKILNDDHYTETYSSDTYASVVSKLGFESHNYRKERFGEERICKIAEFLDVEKPSFLDVGCSTGFVVQAAAEKGWDARGIDLNQHAVEFGVKNHDICLSSESFFDVTQSFDAIGMYDVLEHISRPSDFLKQASKLLVTGGLVHVYVPNWNSASRYILKENAHFIWPSHHLTYFTPKTLGSIIERTGFEVLEIETEGLDLYDVHWMKEEGIFREEFSLSERLIEVLQFLTNAGGHGKNLRCIAKKI